MSAIQCAQSSPFDDALSRLQRITVSSLAHSSAPLRSSAISSYSDISSKFRSNSSLTSYNPPRDYDQPKQPTIVIDTFAPRSLAFDDSPMSPTSSDLDSNSSRASFSKSSVEAFFASRSRVVRLYNLLPSADSFLSAVFLPQSPSEYSRGHIPVPSTMWQLRDEYSPLRSDSVWAVFPTHEEACAALSLSGPAMSVATALESDLEPFHKLQRFVLKPPVTRSSPSPFTSRPPLDLSRPHMFRVSSYPDVQVSESAEPTNGEYTISSNPPNPKNSFRLGDWICNSPKCAAHNFGRNLACIGCGCPRSVGGPSSSQTQGLNSTSTRALPSPRFNNVLNNSATYYSSATPHQQPSFNFTQPSQPTGYPSPVVPHVSNPPKSAHPLLTPSGRAFAVGGKVQNISSDPLSPCIMYWPDNEPFPEQGQIRPNGLVGVPQPPILNTGNRGPISHQPGDWICQKCNYLNWRRRKVCQTCLPYAEGNGDSISAAVQSERIALLTSVLAQTQLMPDGLEHAPPQGPALQSMRSHSLTPPQVRRPFIDISAPPIRSVHRSQSHVQLGGQYASPAPPSPLYNPSSPIYQTSGHRQPSPLYATGPGIKNHLLVQAPAPLLPSFLQDIVQSPALSPTSTNTSSGDLSAEEFDDMSPSSKAVFTRERAGKNSSTSSASPLANIWRLDGEESKSLSAFPLPNRQELMGAKHKASREMLRVQVVA